MGKHVILVIQYQMVIILVLHIMEQEQKIVIQVIN